MHTVRSSSLNYKVEPSGWKDNVFRNLELVSHGLHQSVLKSWTQTNQIKVGTSSNKKKISYLFNLVSNCGVLPVQ